MTTDIELCVKVAKENDALAARMTQVRVQHRRHSITAGLGLPARVRGIEDGKNKVSGKTGN